MFGRCVNGFASSTGSSRFQLANGQGRTTQPLRSSPITGPSTLLRAAPPLRLASVLSPSRLERLDVSLGIGATGSHVPYKSLVELRAACRSGRLQGSPELIPEEGSTPRF